MKKVVSFLLASVMMLTLVACGTTSGGSKGSGSGKSKENYDIVIIGGGGAGLAAAVEAKQNGAENIVVLEKLSFLGGSTTMAFGGFNCAKSKYMTEQGKEEENIDLLNRVVGKNGKNFNDSDVAAVVIEETPSVLEWFESFGSEWGQIRYSDLHCPTDGTIPGVEIIKVLSEQCEKLGVEIRLNTKATKLVTDEEGRINGVATQNENGEEATINCTSVILATGGYSNNPEMIAKDHPDLKNIHFPSSKGAEGDGIVMATELGAKTRNMDLIQLSCAVVPSSIQMQLPGPIKEKGAIFVNKEGNRFVKETSAASSDRGISAAILEQTDAMCYGVYNETIYQNFMSVEDKDFFDEYRINGIDKSGLVMKADTIEELAGMMDVPADALEATIKGIKNSEIDNEAAKEAADTYNEGPYYAVPLTPGVMDTLGGIEIDTIGRVINTDEEPIPGLYAAGEVIGNIQGAYYSIGLGEAVVYGRVSARNAIQYVKDRGGLTEYKKPEGESEKPESKPAAKGNFVDGTFTGTAKGNNDDLTVEVTVKDGSITEIKVVDDKETPNIFAGVVDKYIPSIIESQDLEVDTITGATNSCNAVKEALKSVLKTN
ncbi:MAG: flavocytochrome c [Clostridium sp.]|nr:flavocytochrome c [Clostridium sp.]MDU7083615.1 flavocytochrome c [Clostridium sp.]